MVSLIKPKELSEILEISLKTAYLKLHDIDTFKFRELILIKNYYNLNFDDTVELIEKSKL